ncbi:MAG: M56 family metallopeptidase [Pseudomonadota bacterium]
MALTKALIEAYLDANIILAVSAAVWVCASALLARTAVAGAYRAHLRLAKVTLLVTLASPILALAVSYGIGALVPHAATTLTDIAVARYLDGGVRLDAVTVETWLNLRQSFILDLVYARSLGAQLLLVGLGAGAALCALWVGLQILRLRQLLASSYLWRRIGRVDLRLSDRVVVPFSTRGLFRRHVVIPSAMVTDGPALRLVLAHEFEHFRRGDLEWEVFAVALRPLFFWNPGYWLWARALERLRELGCDQALVQRRQISPIAYGRCLLDVCARARKTGQAETLVMPKVSFLSPGKAKRNAAFLRQRIDAISLQASDEPVRLSAMIMAFGVMGVVLILSAAALQRPSDWSQDRLMLSTIANLERFQSSSFGARPVGY